jgi:hypothetical protein
LELITYNVTFWLTNHLYRISNFHFEVNNVGKTVKKSKQRHSWLFKSGNKDHKVNFYTSHYSGKKKIEVNSREIVNTKAYKDKFFYEF